ncbi:hypothetical protein KTG70_15690 [Acinetobacter variabilis]|uniref:hypothetical protein n=1 Tax=Acinetobacter variabilis TaxID=70346 RepID=UPI0021CD88D6|nr:hypothetical protein [Acinetobacter variabilis]MCU4366505.1 hypothetical protein [Acinetobacter variabilis]
MNTKVDEGKLIGGKEALIALANGGEIQWATGDDFQDITDDWQIREFLHPSFKFRLKPRTITINGIEVPAPFEPKAGEEYFYIQSCRNGYARSRFNSEHCDQHLVALGAWRTEEEIKQVVAALCQVFGGSHDN